MITPNSIKKITRYYRDYIEATTKKQKENLPCDLSFKQTNGFAFFISQSIITNTKFWIEICAVKYSGSLGSDKFVDAIDKCEYEVELSTTRKNGNDDVLIAIEQLNEKILNKTGD